MYYDNLIVMQSRKRLKSQFMWHHAHFGNICDITEQIKAKSNEVTDKLDNGVNNCPLGSSLTRNLYTSHMNGLYSVT